MQVLQAGEHKLILLELDAELINTAARQAGFDVRVKDSPRGIVMDLTAVGRAGPLLLFDAADPGNLGWFSRCQFYIDGRTGLVMQTPISLANKKDRSGKNQSNAVRIRILQGTPRVLPIAPKATADRAGVLRLVAELPACVDADWRSRMRGYRGATAHRTYRSHWPAQLVKLRRSLILLIRVHSCPSVAR